MTKLYAELEEQSLEEKRGSRKEEFQREKSEYQDKIQILEKELEANRALYETEADKLEICKESVEDETAALGVLLKKKEVINKDIEEETSKEQEFNSKHIEQQDGLLPLQKALAFVGSEDESSQDAYLYHEWYLPLDSGTDFMYESLEPYMNWGDSIPLWRKIFEDSRNHHTKTGKWLRGWFKGTKESSPHYQLKQQLNDLLGTEDEPGTFKKTLNEFKKKLDKAREELAAKQKAMEAIVAQEIILTTSKADADTALTKQSKTVSNLVTLIDTAEKDKKFAEAMIDLKDYQLTLLDLETYRLAYDKTQESLKDVELPGDSDTELKIKRLESAILTLTDLSKKYNPAHRQWLEEKTQLLSTERFNPIREEKAFQIVEKEIKSHSDIVESINDKLVQYQTNKKALERRAEIEREDRKKKREELVNACLDKDDRQGYVKTDQNDLGHFTSYLLQRANHYWVLDCLQSFFKKIVQCFRKYEPEADRRSRLLNDDIKPALIRYRNSGDKSELQQIVTPMRKDVHSRTKKGRTGYECTFHAKLDLMDEMPTMTEVVRQVQDTELVEQSGSSMLTTTP